MPEPARQATPPAVCVAESPIGRPDEVPRRPELREEHVLVVAAHAPENPGETDRAAALTEHEEVSRGVDGGAVPRGGTADGAVAPDVVALGVQLDGELAPEVSRVGERELPAELDLLLVPADEEAVPDGVLRDVVRARRVRERRVHLGPEHGPVRVVPLGPDAAGVRDGGVAPAAVVEAAVEPAVEAASTPTPRGDGPKGGGITQGREALLRYILRPAIAQERVEQRPDGLVRITLKRA